MVFSKALAVVSVLLLGSGHLAVAAERGEKEWLNEVSRAQKQYGANDARYGELLFAAGTYFHKQKNIAQEEQMFRKAMAVFEKSPGTGGDLLRYYSSRLGEIYLTEGKLVESEKQFKTALAIGKKLPPKEQTYALPDTYLGLGKLMLAQKKYSEAEGYFKQRIELRKRFLNANQVDVALLDLANLYTSWGKLDEAKPLFEKLMSINPRPAAVRDGWKTYQSRVSADGKTTTQ